METKDLIDLKDLIPEPSDVTLTVNGELKTFTLRAFSLSDRVWVTHKFGERVQEIFSQLNMPEICKIVYHQLEDGDKELFQAQDVEYFDDDGEKKKTRLTGPQVLMSCIKGGPLEEVKVIQSLLKCIGVSEPILSKSEEEKIESKKKQKTNRKKRTGRKSLTA